MNELKKLNKNYNKNKNYNNKKKIMKTINCNQQWNNYIVLDFFSIQNVYI